MLRASRGLNRRSRPTSAAAGDSLPLVTSTFTGADPAVTRSRGHGPGAAAPAWGARRTSKVETLSHREMAPSAHRVPQPPVRCSTIGAPVGLPPIDTKQESVTAQVTLSCHTGCGFLLQPEAALRSVPRRPLANPISLRLGRATASPSQLKARQSIRRGISEKVDGTRQSREVELCVFSSLRPTATPSNPLMMTSRSPAEIRLVGHTNKRHATTDASHFQPG